MPPKPSLRIGLLLYPACMPAGLFAFADLLHGANRRSGRRLFAPLFVAAQTGPVDCAHGQLLSSAALVQQATLDAVLIPGFWGESARQVSEAMTGNARLVAALTGLPKSTMLWSYCTGVSLLAATGRLNGQRATATWWLADLLQEQHPRVMWQPEQTCVFNPRTATASGVNGHLPIAQAFIEKHLSEESYRDLAKLMVLPRPERSHHAFRTMNLMEQPDTLLRKLYALAEQMPATGMTVRRIAGELNTTERTLARKVLAAAGMPVASYLRRIKLNQASERLIHTSASVSTISAELGFSSDSSMRRMFKDLTSMTPAEYRQHFGRR